MEDGLVHVILFEEDLSPEIVLILVVMEDGLVRGDRFATSIVSIVLILVVMEDGLVQEGELCFIYNEAMS